MITVKTSDFNFDLPEELIAQTPLERRDASRLLTLDKVSGQTEHHHFYELVDMLQPGDCSPSRRVVSKILTCLFMG